ncbi:DUF2461 domain-containing protein [Porticoccus sp. W117]|uniref:DUF2461 domain-containing protein n=1 Tax=Porticoccus sp. W117 TaxID=3054777 RepID=UPI002598C446|nr:DUF2461 domain-containing protein [Porticoccus sp. W117]MDM3871996.1 DUF2461 domain-containing protein [Porticoccus sp. W117]
MPFTTKTISFLQQLRTNNNRDWFNDHKQDYEDVVRTPALEFIEQMAAPLAKISPQFEAIPKKVGGSLMRIYRDTRFGKDKTPYKTNIGIQFRHRLGKDVHAPGFYLHIEPGEVFVGVGIWRPDSATLLKIRTAITEKPKPYQQALAHKPFQHFSMAGDSLKRPPRGFDAEHPLVEELKRKDFIAVTELDEKVLFEKSLVNKIAKQFDSATPLMKFLCQAIDVKF